MKSKTELMNIVALAAENVTTVAVRYPTKTSAGRQTCNFLVRRNVALTLAKDDWVVVPSNPNGFAAVRVVEVHDEPQLDDLQDIEYKWIVQPVDTTAYDASLDWQKQTASVLMNNQRKTAAQAVMQQMGVDPTCLQLSAPGDDTTRQSAGSASIDA